MSSTVGSVLTQSEADALMALVKQFVDPPPAISIPPGADDRYELAAVAGREKFILDVLRGTLRLTRLTLNERVRASIVLARLDIDGRPHTNPDGSSVGRSHLHVYREGFEERWAIPLHEVKGPDGRLLLPEDPTHAQLFGAFCAFCNIESPPLVQGWIQ